MFVPVVVDSYLQEVLLRGGDHELQFAGSALGHIRWGTSQQRCSDKVKRHVLNQSICPVGPPTALH